MPDAGKVIVMLDSPDPWGMKVNSFRKVRGNFRLMSEQATARFAGMPQQSMTPVRVIEDGPVRLVVEALFHYKSSNLCVRYKLPRLGAEIEIELRIYWNEKDRMVKLSLPFFDSQAKLLGQTAFGVDQLPVTGLECTAQKWVMLTNGDHALSVINDRTYGLDLKDGELRISLLRSPAYAAHPIPDRPILPPERFMPRQDQGERLFHFWIQGGNLKDRLDRIEREALIKNEPPMTLSFFPSGQGQLPLPAIRLNDEVIQVSAVKKAEDENALIIRLYEPTGTTRDTILELPWAGVSYPVSLKGFEIRTISFNLDDHHFRELNLVEDALIVNSKHETW
jgi:alpha-mannosidase